MDGKGTNILLRSGLSLIPTDSQIELPVSVLNALSMVGDPKDLSIVRALIDGQGLARSNKKITAAAQYSLPILREQVARITSKKMLLRPASFPIDLSLRPLIMVNSAEPDILLRAAYREMSQT